MSFHFRCLRKYEGHRGAVWACSLNQEEGYLLTCGADNYVMMWQAAGARNSWQACFSRERDGSSVEIQWKFNVFIA